MIKAFYLVEAATAGGVVWLAVHGWLWVYRTTHSWPGPLWLCLPLATLTLGYLLRWRREVTLVSWLVGWHESIRRRIDEGQP